eukprot:scaffold14720_cov29-Tisochrysis_lutea.AAC.2
MESSTSVLQLSAHPASGLCARDPSEERGRISQFNVELLLPNARLASASISHAASKERPRRTISRRATCRPSLRAARHVDANGQMDGSIASRISTSSSSGSS